MDTINFVDATKAPSNDAVFEAKWTDAATAAAAWAGHQWHWATWAVFWGTSDK